MSDRLESFIKQNRKQFDGFEPAEGLWDKIEQGLNSSLDQQPAKEKVIKLNVLYRIAASIILVLASGLAFFCYQKNESLNISNISPELAKEQMHYASLIKVKREELKEVKNEEPELYKEFSSEIKKLDTNYQKLKKDLETSPNREETVKAMISNLKIQSQVLNQQLNIIDQVEQLKKEENETKGI